MKLKYKSNETILEVKEVNGVTFLQYPIFNQLDVVKHGFSTRLGGVSSGKFASMNLTFDRGDHYELVQENYSRIASAIGVRKEHVVCSKQTHTNRVLVVDETYAGNGVIYPNKLEDIDGLITNVPGLCLATFYADCVPLYFVDPIKKVIGLSHSGWKGTVSKISQETVRMMQEKFGCDIGDILVAIGPSICQDCYEVSEDVIEEFKKAYSAVYWPELFYQKENGKYQLNLWRANEIALEEFGVAKEHIVTTNVCTCCNPELLFSHRASKGERGNLGAFLSLIGEE